jgi:hypothetical protein
MFIWGQESLSKQIKIFGVKRLYRMVVDWPLRVTSHDPAQLFEPINQPLNSTMLRI